MNIGRMNSHALNAATNQKSPSLILSRAQAEAVYSAMCALNNVGARLDKTTLAGGELYASENDAGRVLVNSLEAGDEAHASQYAFATAYGLNSDEWPNDVAAAAGGLTQTAIER